MRHWFSTQQPSAPLSHYLCRKEAWLLLRVGPCLTNTLLWPLGLRGQGSLLSPASTSLLYKTSWNLFWFPLQTCQSITACSTWCKSRNVKGMNSAAPLLCSGLVLFQIHLLLTRQKSCFERRMGRLCQDVIVCLFSLISTQQLSCWKPSLGAYL